MSKRTLGGLGFLLLGAVLSAGTACAQTAKDVAGSWTLVSIVTEQNGTKTDIYGPNPKGMLMVDASGRYLITCITPHPRRGN